MTITHSVQDSILIIEVDNPPANAISLLERRGLMAAMDIAYAMPVAAVIIRGASRSFIAGADINELSGPVTSPSLPDVINAIDRCPWPVIAAIDGPALGGGLEIALACDYRLASRRSKLGFPEVSLGIVPGAGGTQRLSRLIAPVEAARIISSGTIVTAEQALSLNLIDTLVEDDVLEAAIQMCQSSSEPLERRRLSQLPPLVHQDMQPAFEALIAQTNRSARGAVAPLAAIDLVKLALSLPFTDAVAREREVFLRLRDGSQATALRHVFFAERAAGKLPNDEGASVWPILRVGVVGAGTMGVGIAIAIAEAGLPVCLVDSSMEALDRARSRIAEHHRSRVARGRTTQSEADAQFALIVPQDDYRTLRDCDLIIEAAFESMAVKRAIFRDLNSVAKPTAILATNTSYLDVDLIAAESGRPSLVAGLHFFSPANVMKLVEVIRSQFTTPDTLATCLAFAKKIKKVPVIAGVCNGFIGNRMLRAYNREAGLFLLEGADPAQVDDALTNFGMAMGPFAVADLSGLDIGYKARREMEPNSFEPLSVFVHDALVEAGDLGRKSGRGFYSYDDSGTKRSVNPLVDQILTQRRRSEHIAPRLITDEEIVRRCLLALANEGGHILDEGVAIRSSDIDIVYVNGYGFPRHRGGPMYYAGSEDPEAALQYMATLSEGRFGHWWNASSLFR